MHSRNLLYLTSYNKVFQGKSVSEQNDLKCIAFEKKTFAGLLFMFVLYEKNLYCLQGERRRKHSYKWDYQSGRRRRRSKNCVSLSPLLRSPSTNGGMSGGEKKVKKSMCGTYSSERRVGGSLRCMDVRSQAFSSDLIAKTRLALELRRRQQVILSLYWTLKKQFYSSL